MATEFIVSNFAQKLLFAELFDGCFILETILLEQLGSYLCFNVERLAFVELSLYVVDKDADSTNGLQNVFEVF